MKSKRSWKWRSGSNRYSRVSEKITLRILREHLLAEEKRILRKSVFSTWPDPFAG